MRDRSLRRRAVRGASVAVALVAALALLSGCVGIPTSGEVTVGDTSVDDGGGDLEFLPAGPAPGATQEEILRGYVGAFSSSAGDYEVARKYLTRGLAASWAGNSNVTVRAVGSADPIVAVDDDSLRYTISSAAAVDGAGIFRQNDAAEALTLSFDLVRQGGEWRIDTAPDGIVLSDALFQRLFRQHSLYFLDPASERLVPDVRWFLAGSEAARIGSTLLEGPPAWLQGAVRTAFPSGTQFENIDVRGGDAVVDLSTDALDADARDRRLMQVQLDASLGDVANIRSVSLTVSGTPLDVAPAGGPTPLSDPGGDTRSLVGDGSRFGYLSGSTIETIPGISGKVVSAGAVGATLSADSVTAAILSPAGVSIVRAASTTPLTVDSRPALLTPSLDPFGYVWSASPTDPGSLRVFDLEGSASDISTGLPAGGRLVSIDVSRDGARLALLLANDDSERLVVVAITRNPDDGQRPTGLSAPALDAVVEAALAVDAAWVDDISVATLTASDEQSLVTVFVVGGERETLGGLQRGSALAGGNGLTGLSVLSAAGTLLQRSSNSWTDTGLPISFIATQQ